MSKMSLVLNKTAYAEKYSVRADVLDVLRQNSLVYRVQLQAFTINGRALHWPAINTCLQHTDTWTRGLWVITYFLIYG